MPVRSRFVVYPTGHKIYRPNPPEPMPITIERHIDGRLYKAEVPIEGTLSLRETAAFFGVNPATIWRRVRSGKLKAVKRRGELRVEVKEVFHYTRRTGGIWLA